MNIPDAIKELGGQIGLPELALDDSGRCRIVFDDRLTVDFETGEDGRTLHLFSSLMLLEDAHDEEFCATLLTANFLGLATGGARFALSDATDEWHFEQSLDMDALNYTAFANAVESYVNHLEVWKDKLARGLTV